MFATTQQVGFKATGTKCTVGDNPISKLKYYLNCVLGLIDVDKEGMMGRICDYKD